MPSAASTHTVPLPPIPAPPDDCSYQLTAAVRALLSAFEAGLWDACSYPSAAWGGVDERLSRLLDAAAQVVPAALPQYDVTTEAGFEAAVAELAGRWGQTGIAAPCLSVRRRSRSFMLAAVRIVSQRPCSIPFCAPSAEAIEPELEPILTGAMGSCTWSGTAPGASAGLDPSAPGSDGLGASSPSPGPQVIDASHPPAPPSQGPAASPARSPSGSDGIGDLLAAQKQLYGAGCTTCLMTNVLASQHQASMAIIQNIG